MFKLLTKILMLTTFLGTSLTSQCGDGIAFKDEKCFKVFDKLVEQSMAEEVCRQSDNESVLAIFKTGEEQQLIEKYLKTTNIVDNVWIDVKKSNDSFKYSDGNDIEYKNWAKDRPLKNSNDNNCVVISVDDSNYGKWVDEKCKKKNAVLCGKNQAWSIARLQNFVLDTRRVEKQKIEELVTLSKIQSEKIHKLENVLSETKRVQNENIDQLKKETNNLKSNPVPIGFVYAQLSDQLDPKSLWPNTEWANISAKYSGLFFRAEGGQSTPFGRIQEQQTQSFKIYNDYTNGNHTNSVWKTITEKPLANYIYTGMEGSSGRDFGININHNNEEIYPRNQAIRIWQRIK